MSTIGYENWAVDLAEVGAIYPFQGTEVWMTVIAVAFWLIWHFIQLRRENAEYKRIASTQHTTREEREKSIERY